LCQTWGRRSIPNQRRINPKDTRSTENLARYINYKIVKKILDYVGIYEFERKRPPPKIENSPDEFDDYIKDDYIYCDHVC